MTSILLPQRFVLLLGTCMVVLLFVAAIIQYITQALIIYLEYVIARLVESGRFATYALEIIEWGQGTALSQAALHGDDGLVAQLESFAWLWEAMQKQIKFLGTILTKENYLNIINAAKSAAITSQFVTISFVLTVICQLAAQYRRHLFAMRTGTYPFHKALISHGSASSCELTPSMSSTYRLRFCKL
jgi:hypothetical protein